MPRHRQEHPPRGEQSDGAKPARGKREAGKSGAATGKPSSGTVKPSSGTGKSSSGKRREADRPAAPVDLRIIGGVFRGSKLAYEPFVQLTGKRASSTPAELVTRPMKNRVREAIFNLVGVEAQGKHAVDLFAGTGALGLEALSRGAARVTFIERHVPTAGVLRENIEGLGVVDRSELLVTSAFVWGVRDLGKKWPSEGDGAPWLVFVSPPYDFFLERQAEMLALVEGVLEHAPPDSLLVVEADQRFDFALLPGNVRETRHDTGWDVREYHPAVVGVWRT
ncbi:MAG: RsmD family RNA methyltransferase [Lacipirellulaceae bacterium]